MAFPKHLFLPDEQGFTEAEASWILEDNVKMHRLLEAFGGTVNKTYRIYERTL
jgi:hypothetical protein